MPKKHRFLFDGNPVSLKQLKNDVIEQSIKEVAQDYISGRELSLTLHLKRSTLQSWRRQGKLRTIKIANALYYSRLDLLDLTNSTGE